MASHFTVVLISTMVVSSFLSSSAAQQTCSSYTFSNNKAFNSCTELPQLGASLHYTLTPSSNAINIAFKAPQSSDGWVAWGLNPKSTKMVGTQAIVAFFHSNGSIIAYPTQLDSYMPSMAPEDLSTEDLSFPASDVAAEYVKNEMIIYATLKLPGGSTKFNHVWQEGGSVANDVPQAHPTSGDNIESLGTIDFQ